MRIPFTKVWRTEESSRDASTILATSAKAGSQPTGAYKPEMCAPKVLPSPFALGRNSQRGSIQCLWWFSIRPLQCSHSYPVCSGSPFGQRSWVHLSVWYSLQKGQGTQGYRLSLSSNAASIRLRPLIFGVEVIKTFFRANVRVLAIARLT